MMGKTFLIRVKGTDTIYNVKSRIVEMGIAAYGEHSSSKPGLEDNS
jgi:hypothetical protein